MHLPRLLLLLLVSPLALAQTVPDAGQLRQQIERGLPTPNNQSMPREALPPAPMAAPTGPILIQEFQFAGNTLLSKQALAVVTQAWLNRPLQFTQLQEVAIAVADAYRAAGWVVRAYLPRQEIVNGVVRIQIVEARFGRVQTEAPSTLRHREIAPFVAIAQRGQSQGRPLDAKALDRALLLLSDLPGVEVAGSLTEGQQQAESDLILKINDKPWWSGDAGSDNTGSRSTGAARLTANLAINSPWGRLDQGQLNLAHTQGSDYLRLAYFVPAGADGLRAGASASVLQYRLVGAYFDALGARGDSSTWGLELSYPALRSRYANIYVTSAWDRKAFKNLSADATTSDYRISTLSLGINGNRRDTGNDGGLTQASATLTFGDVDLRNSPNQAGDAATTQVAGQYSKLRYSVSRQQTLLRQWALLAALSGQVAGKNLDSSEKFYLGGASGVRAYPSGEAGGSDGQLVNLELRWALPSNVALSGFYDWGAVTVNHHNDFAGGALRNQLQLQGAGLALGWTSDRGISTKITWARRLGENPNPSATGNDQDGSLLRDRFWLHASASF
ncbi:MAG: peptide transporter [Burkholderiales bacterium PBB3]|nr:MAG: peptide transporter [Burkholderiales bacterium PBB3]